MPIPLKWVNGLKISGSDWNENRLYKPYSYIVFKEDSIYYAFGQYNGSTDYSGSNAALVIQSAVDAPTIGGAVFFRSGTYNLTASINLNQSVSLIGESCAVISPAAPPADPDYAAIATGGVIFSIDAASTDGITIGKDVAGITIQDIIINFTQSSTGTGINADPEYNNNGVLYCKFDNIFVLNHDVNHYGFRFVNFQHCQFGRLWSEGGLGFYFANNSNGVDYGNSVAQELFSRTKFNINLGNYIVDFTSAGLASHVLAFMNIQRLQIMDVSDSNTNAALHFNNVQFASIGDTDIEMPASKKLIKIENSSHIGISVTNLSGGSIIHTNTGWCEYRGNGYISAHDYSGSTDASTDSIAPTVQTDIGTISGFLNNKPAIYRIGVAHFTTGETQKVVDSNLGHYPTAIHCTPDWNTTPWASTITDSGSFTIIVNNASGTDNYVFWRTEYQP